MEVLRETTQNALPIEQSTRLELQHPIDRNPVKVHRPPLNRVRRARLVKACPYPVNLIVDVHII